MKTTKEVKDILELAVGEVDYVIPSDVLEDCITYLDDYERMKSAQSWADYPENMGR